MRQQAPLERQKVQKTIHSIYQNGKDRLYFNKAHRILTLCAQETRLPEKEKTREKVYCPHIAGSRLDGPWFHRCSGRWRQ